MSKDRKLVSAKRGLQTDKDYQDLLRELQSILSGGLLKAYKAVDNIKVQMYWQIGERIVREELAHKDRANYGEYLVSKLSHDLGTSRRDLYRIIQFYRLYEIVTAVSSQLSWSHYVELIEINIENKRLFYQNKAIFHSWSVRQLREQIRGQLYEKTSPNDIEAVFQTKLPTTTPQEVFKDAYDFNFIELEHHDGEKDIERKMLASISTFLKEIGEDFAFRGNQVPIKIKGETHFIDIVLGHWGIPCTIIVELKIGKFESGYVGQLNEYVSYWRRHRQYPHEKDAIGLLICLEADREKVSYALDGLEEKIFVAEYRVKLPSEAEIIKAIQDL